MGNREMTIFRAILAIACLAVTGPVTAQTPEKNKSPYPIVINDLKALRSAGLTLTQRGEFKANFPHLKHRCYSYGDGGYLISVDDDFLRRHEARGFTLNSLCMGLLSGIRFDPETGKRLPAFVVVTNPAPKKNGKRPKPAVLYGELPLGVPDCFKQGTPYSDCKMTFDPMTGKKHKDTTVAFYADLGRQIEADFKTNKAAGRWKTPCAAGSDRSMDCYRETAPDDIDKGFLYFDAWPDPKDPKQSLSQPACCYPSSKPGSWQHQTNFDVSPKLPKGYGYMLYATGEAGGDPDSELLESAQSGSAYATSADIASAIKSWP